MELDRKTVMEDSLELWLLQVPRNLSAEDLEGAHFAGGVLNTKDGHSYQASEGPSVDEVINLFPDRSSLRLGKGFSRGLRLHLKPGESGRKSPWSAREYPQQIEAVRKEKRAPGSYPAAPPVKAELADPRSAVPATVAGTLVKKGRESKGGRATRKSGSPEIASPASARQKGAETPAKEPKEPRRKTLDASAVSASASVGFNKGKGGGGDKPDSGQAGSRNVRTNKSKGEDTPSKTGKRESDGGTRGKKNGRKTIRSKEGASWADDAAATTKTLTKKRERESDAGTGERSGENKPKQKTGGAPRRHSAGDPVPTKKRRGGNETPKPKGGAVKSDGARVSRRDGKADSSKQAAGDEALNQPKKKRKKAANGASGAPPSR